MKKQLFFLLTLSLLLFTAGCSADNVSRAEKVIGDSSLFTQDEIESAMDIVIDHFRNEFEGCTLIEIEYDEAHSAKFSSEWADQYGAEEAIVLLSVFDVDKNGGDGSFNHSSTYSNWQWVLTRSNSGSWELKTWGYG